MLYSYVLAMLRFISREKIYVAQYFHFMIREHNCDLL